MYHLETDHVKYQNENDDWRIREFQEDKIRKE